MMVTDKNQNQRFPDPPISTNHYFYRNKNTLLVIFILIFLLIFPFLIYSVISTAFGAIELSDLEKNVNILIPEETLSGVSNYYQNYSPGNSILKVKLQALERLTDPSLEIQIQKIRIIKILLQESWFPDLTLYKKLAKIFYDMHYYPEALDYLEIYMANNEIQSSQDLLESYTILYNISTFTENYQQRIISAQKILTILPNDLQWSLKLAQSYIADSQLIEARQELENLIHTAEGSPQYYEIFFTLIDVLTQLKLNDKVDFYLRYLATTHSSPDQENLFLTVYAQYLITQGDVEKAVKKWEASYIIFNPKNKNKNIKNYFDQYLKS